MAPIFIRLFKNLEEAMYVDESPQTKHGDYKGVQMLPNDPLPYRQVTDHPTGIELEDWTVKVMSLCGRELGDISSSFVVEDNFTDNDGIPQIYWSLKNIPTDFGVRLIYLKITQTVGEIFYSQPFQITAYESEYVSRVDYRDSEFDYMQSMGLQFYFRNYRNVDIQDNYYEVSTGITRTLTTQRQRPSRMFTKNMSNDLMVKVVDALQSRYLYRNLVRNYLFEVPEIPDPEGDANFRDMEFLLTTVPGEVYDPLYVAPIPTPPEPGDGITVKIKAENLRNGSHRVVLRFDTIPGYTEVQFGFSTLTGDGQTVGYNEDVYSVIGLAVVVFGVLLPGVVPSQVTINSFTVRMRNPNDSQVYDFVYTTPDIVFTAPDITNAIEKEVTATLV